jgi:YHS domain-containing protein
MTTKLISCDVCGNLFEKENKKINESIKKGWNNFCSNQCYRDGRKNGVLLECVYCGKPVWRTQSQLKRSKSGNVFCNRGCATSFNNTYYKSKENNPNYIDGSSSYRKLALEHYEAKCKYCGYDVVQVVQIHHIDGNRENNDLSNLEVVCRNCHGEIHFGLKPTIVP